MKQNNFTKTELLKLCKTVVEDDIYIDLNSFHEELMISQVVRFFERHGRKFTKTMIQNYVRVGIIPPPVEKRYYTRNHLILLTLIDNLKSAYSLDEIKLMLAPILKDPNTFEDDIINVQDLYNEYMNSYNKTLNNWQEMIPSTFDDINLIIKNKNIDSEDLEVSFIFLTVLTLMTQSIALKKLSNMIIEEFFTKNE